MQALDLDDWGFVGASIDQALPPRAPPRACTAHSAHPPARFCNSCSRAPLDCTRASSFTCCVCATRLAATFACFIASTAPRPRRPPLARSGLPPGPAPPSAAPSPAAFCRHRQSPTFTIMAPRAVASRGAASSARGERRLASCRSSCAMRRVRRPPTQLNSGSGGALNDHSRVPRCNPHRAKQSRIPRLRGGTYHLVGCARAREFAPPRRTGRDLAWRRRCRLAAAVHVGAATGARWRRRA